MGVFSKIKKKAKSAVKGATKAVKNVAAPVDDVVKKAGDWVGDKATNIAQDPLGGVGNALYESTGKFGGMGHLLGEDTMRGFAGNPLVQGGVGAAASFLPGGVIAAPLLGAGMGAYTDRLVYI